jgi:hypothetical protein
VWRFGGGRVFVFAIQKVGFFTDFCDEMQKIEKN